ncbi:MAG: hypothetical protein HY820_16590 [Acidobacteria bacterium]|nr:hypothetical protein [Acidobacteriota bacterium]
MRLHFGHVAMLAFFVGTAAVSHQFQGYLGSKSTMVMYWLSALGITGIAFFALIQQKLSERKKAKEAEGSGAAAGGGSGAGGAAAGSGAEGDVDLLVKDAEARFTASSIGQGAKLSSMPVVFVVGDRGSTKTHVLMHSGMEAELLAGQVYQQDNMISPTRAANFWFARKAVFVEAGGPLWADGASWTRLLKKLAPTKLSSVFGKGKAAPRAAMVCVDLERFLQPGASDSMATAARGIQARLQEFSEQFGISFPVYVLFTRSDRVPFFHDFVHNLSNEEATQVFGATLPLKNTRVGIYAEDETRRLNEYFNELFYSLCDKRIEYLPREGDAEKLPGCYEFPREFRKLRATIVQFLVDVGRPSQLSTSAFLRGFYFSAVRPVIVNDIAPTPSFQQPQRPAFDAGGSATRMFSIGDFQQQQVPMAAPQQTGGKKVPQWVFLSQLFNNVILEDKAALGASAASTKTSALQRILLGTVAFLALFWSIALTWSFFNNRALERHAIDATKAIKSVRQAPGTIPSIDDLRRLDSLRLQLEQLTKWKKDGAPYGYRWGLYVGNSLLPAVRKAYYDCFNQLLLSETQTRMVGFLRSRPSKAREEDDYNYAYETLRAHLVTTSEWKHIMDDDAQPPRLSGVLVARWSEGRDSTIGEERKALSNTQFQFYSGDLRNGNPFPPREDAEGADKSRIYLASFSGFERLYNSLLGRANSRFKPVNFNATYPGSAAVVTNSKDVPGAFTKDGWAFMQGAFKKKEFGGEEWVLLPNKYKAAASVPENLDDLLRARYRDDYIKQWREYFARTGVAGYRNPADAAAKLQHHSDGRAPILALMELGSYHTAVEPAGEPYADAVRKAFQWPQIVAPPQKDFRTYILGNNRPYTEGLGGLQGIIETASRMTPPDAGTMAQVEMFKSQARSKKMAVEASPGTDSEGRLDQIVDRIMDAPIKGLDDIFSPANALNAEGAAFCAAFNALTNKFPFNPVADPEVTLDELNMLLRPGTGKLSQLAEKMKQPGVKLNPVFSTFFNNVKAMADAFYRAGNDPVLNYTVQFAEAANIIEKRNYTNGNISIDGKQAKLGSPAVSYVWNGAPQVVTVSLDNDTKNSKKGPWAIFRFFVDATLTPQGANYLLAYPLISGREKFGEWKFVVNLSGAPPVFDKRFFANLKCVPTVALK